tara:strand:- start:1361 stop:2170 length:810 start_codon:yes stop_codon:yes gene_type:complete
MKNVLIITQNEPFYIPKMIRYILEKKNKDINIVGYTILKPHRKNKNFYHWFMERARIYSFFELMIVFFAMMLVKFFGFFSDRYSVQKIMNQYSVKEFFSDDINSDNYIRLLEPLNLDFIISISCPHLFEEKLLSIPRLACINAHGTLLPRHRGVFGSWWTVYKNDMEAGGTIHTMELKLDAGEILWQEEFLVDKNDTQYSIAYKTKKMMARGLLDAIKNFDKIISNPIQSKYQSSYHRSPSRKLGKDFHKKGNRVLTVRDLKRMLSSKY